MFVARTLITVVLVDDFSVFFVLGALIIFIAAEVKRTSATLCIFDFCSPFFNLSTFGALSFSRLSLFSILGPRGLSF